MIRDYQAIQRTWFEKGKQRVIKTTGKHRGVKLLATVDYCTEQAVWQESEEYTAQTVTDKLSSPKVDGASCPSLDDKHVRMPYSLDYGR